MKEEGPLLEVLTRRLAECPGDFLEEPKAYTGEGTVDVVAIVYDLIRDLGGAPLSKKDLGSFFPVKKSKNNVQNLNHFRLILIVSWLLHDVWFRSRGRFAQEALLLLTIGLNELAGLVQAGQFIADPDRREELARFCLKELGLRPAGESEAQAQDRLTTLDSIERSKVVKAAREAEERARLIREEMARKAAEEAAANWGRE